MLLTKLFVHRGPSGPRILTLSSSALALLLQYGLKLQGQPGRLSRQAAILAGKIALILHAISTSAVHEIPAATMIAAIEIADAIIAETNAAANRCVSSHGTSGLMAKAARQLKIDQVELRGCSSKSRPILRFPKGICNATPT